MKEYNVLVFEREKKQVSTIFGPAYFVLQMQPGFGTSTWRVRLKDHDSTGLMLSLYK